jgi:hypothetical protein
MPGIRNFLKTIGAINIIEINMVKTMTGSLNGNSGILNIDMLVSNFSSANVSQLDGISNSIVFQNCNAKI